MNKYKNLHETQKFAIAIPLLFLLSCLTKHYVERFRISLEFRWIYEYASIGSLILCFVLIFFSLANSILILRDLKTKLLPKILWLLLSSSIFLLTAGLLIAIAFDFT